MVKIFKNYNSSWTIFGGFAYSISIFYYLMKRVRQKNGDVSPHFVPRQLSF